MACRPDAPPRNSGGGYLEIDLGGEQQHKNKYVVMDALFIAHALNRTLIEPAVVDSRLGSADLGGASLALHDYWDLQPLCERFPARLMPRAAFTGRHDAAVLRRLGAVVEPKRGRAFPGGWRLHSASAVRAAFAHAERAPLIRLRGAWRSITNEELLADDVRTLPYEALGGRPFFHHRTAMLWEPNPGYDRLAQLLLAHVHAAAVLGQAVGGAEKRRLAAAMMAEEPGARLLAVQWRTEDWEHNEPNGSAAYNSSSAASLTACAGWVARRLQRAMAQHRLTAVFVATDLRAGASGSYAGARRPAARAALLRLERLLPAVRQPRLNALIGTLPDSGMRANLEAAICARARLLLSSAADACTDCAKARRCSKMSSAFGAHVLHRRNAYGRPSEPLF